jgi:hypothetical protein
MIGKQEITSVRYVVGGKVLYIARCEEETRYWRVGRAGLRVQVLDISRSVKHKSLGDAIKFIDNIFTHRLREEVKELEYKRDLLEEIENNLLYCEEIKKGKDSG